MSFFSDIFDTVADWFSSDGASTVASAADTIVQGAQLVGGVLAVAGAVTGNRKLLNIGSVIGIGATAISAFSGLSDAASAPKLTDSGADPTGELAASTSDLSAASVAPTMSVGDSLSAAPSPFESGQGLIGSNMAGLSTPAAQAPSSMASLDVPAAQTAPSFTTPSDTPVTAGSAGGTEGVRVSDSTLGQGTSIGAQAAEKLNSPDGGVTSGQSKGLIDGVLGFVKKNPEIVKLGAGLIGGAVQGYQQDAALRNQQRMYEDQRARFNRSILDQNLNRP